TVLGGVTNFKLIDQLSFKVTTVFETILLILIFVNFALLKNYWILLVMLFLGAFFVSKANAKINALIIEMTEPDMLATVSGTITSMAMIAVPAGTITVGVLYNVVSPIVTYLFGMVVLIIALGCAVFSKSNA
ncbi:MFS transporter, partial [Apilactobacillus ozensis]|uniref:MFS transporter n=1 Tax=Apilactobacillus ozensis TaxID=866801 RepID=UPI000A63AE54